MKMRKGLISLITAVSMVVTSIGGGLFVAPASTAFAASHDIKIFLSATGYTGKNDVSKFDAFTVDNDGTVTAGAERAGLNWKGGLAGFGTQGYMTLTGSYPKTLPSKMERPAAADGDNKADFKLSLKWIQDGDLYYFINKNGVAITDSNDTVIGDGEVAVIGDSVDINWYTAGPGSKGVVKVQWGLFNSKTGEWVAQDADGAEDEEVQLYKANILTNEIRILDPRLNDFDDDGAGWHGSKSDYTGKDSYDIDSHENDDANADSSVPLMVLYMDGTGNYVTLTEEDFTEIDGQILTRIGWASSDSTIASLKEIEGFEKGSQEDVFGNRNGSADITAQTEFSLDGGQKWETGKNSKLKIISDAYVSAIKAVVRYNDDKFRIDPDVEADTNKGQDPIATNADFNDAHVVSPAAPVDLSQNARWSTISLSAKTSSTYQTLPEGTKYRWYVEGKYSDRIKLELLEGTSKAKITALASIPAEDPVKVYAYAENEKQFDDRLAESLDSKYVDQYNLFGKNGKGGEVFGIGVQYTATNLEPCVFVPGGSGSIGTDNGREYVSVKFSLVEDGKYNKLAQDFTDVKDNVQYVGYEAVPVAGSSVNILGQMGSDKEEVPTKIFFSGTGKMAVRAYYINADGAVVPTDWIEINVKATTIEVPGEPVIVITTNNIKKNLEPEYCYETGANTRTTPDMYDKVMEIEASGVVQSYRWEYKTGTDTWKSCGTNSSRLAITMNKKAYDNTLFRCVVTSSDGGQATSRESLVRICSGTLSYDPNGGVIIGEEGESLGESYPIYLNPGYIITEDPGEMHREEFEFAGWYTDPTGGKEIKTGTKISGTTTMYAHWSSSKKPIIKMSVDAPDTDEEEIPVYMNGDVLTFSIEDQNNSGITKIDWKYSTDDGKTWKPYSKGKNKASIDVQMTKAAYKGGAIFKCIASNGKESDEDEIYVKRITSPVEEVTVGSSAEGGDAYYLTGQVLNLYAVATGGSKFKYEWFYKPAGDDAQWIPCSGGKKQTLKIAKMTGTYVGASFKCRVTNEDDGCLESDPVIPVHKKVEVSGEASVTRTDGGNFSGMDPTDTYERLLYTNNQTVSLSVNADITNRDLVQDKSIKYSWVYRPVNADPGAAWKSVSGGKKQDLVIKKMTKSYDEVLIKCIITTPDSPAAETAPVYAKMAKAEISGVDLEPSEGFTFVAGASKEFSVSKVYALMNGEGDEFETTVKKYTWEYDLNDGKGWRKCPKGNKAVFSMNLTADYDGARFRCVISNGEDTADTWDDLGIEVTAELIPYALTSFNIEPEATQNYDEETGVFTFKLNKQYSFKAAVSPEPEGKGTKYIWKYLPSTAPDDSEGNWKNISGGTKKILKLTMKSMYDGARIKCTVITPGGERLESSGILETVWEGRN